MTLRIVLCVYMLIFQRAASVSAQPQSSVTTVASETPSKSQPATMKNVYRFSSSDHQTKRRSGDPTMHAVLMECPSEPFIKGRGDTSNALCEEKISVNIRMSSKQSDTDANEKYLLLDEIYDPLKKCKAKLMAPYLLEITRGEPVLMYPLEFKERIHENAFRANKNDAPHNYKTNSHTDAEHERKHLKNDKLYDTKIPEKHFQKTKEKAAASSHANVVQQFSELNYPELEPSDLLYNEENEFSRAQQGVARRDNIYTPNTTTKMGKNVNRRWEDVLSPGNDDNDYDNVVVSRALPADNEYANKDVYSNEKGAAKNDFVGIFDGLAKTDELIKNDMNVYASVLTESASDENAAAKRPDLREYYSLMREDATKTCNCCDCDKCVTVSDAKRCACCFALELCSCAHGSGVVTHMTNDRRVIYYKRDKQHKNRCCDCSESSAFQGSAVYAKNGNADRITTMQHKPISQSVIGNSEISARDAFLSEVKRRDNEKMAQKKRQQLLNAEYDDDEHDDIRASLLDATSATQQLQGDEYDDYDSTSSMVNEWPEMLPQIKLPNAWPNIYQNKSQRQTVVQSNDFKEAHLTWRHRSNGGVGGSGGDHGEDDFGSSSISDSNHKQFHRNADKLKDKMNSLNPKRAHSKDNNKLKYESAAGSDSRLIRLSKGQPYQHRIEQPFVKLLSDANLSTDDKMHIIDVMHSNQRSEYGIRPGAKSPDDIKGNDFMIRSTRADSQMYGDSRLYDNYNDVDVNYVDMDNDDDRNEARKSESHSDRQDKLPKEGDMSNNRTTASMFDRKPETDDDLNVDDVWYSVFALTVPSPFLSTKVRIFRKFSNSWKKIAPTIKLTTSFGNSANINPSTMFLFHTDKSNSKISYHPATNLSILIPSLSANEENTVPTISSLTNYIELNKHFLKTIFYRLNNSNNAHLKANGKLRSLQDLGNFPKNLNVMAQCNDKPDHLCLNMVDEHVPAYGISLVIPLYDNMLIYPDVRPAQISKIMTDITRPGYVTVTISVLNTGQMTHRFSVGVNQLPVVEGSKTKQACVIEPYVSTEIAFHLPVKPLQWDQKRTCEDESGKVVATRSMLVRPMSRCFCLWLCVCSCIGSFAVVDTSDLCKEMSNAEADDAGFKRASNVEQRIEVLNWIALIPLIMFVLLGILIVFGFLKASIGSCFKKIGNWKYDYLQPVQPYDEASIWKRFFINTIFFLVFPCVAACKCFNPAKQDLLESPLLLASWTRSVVQKELGSDDEGYDDEMRRLIKVDECGNTKSVERLRAASDNFAADQLFESYNEEEEDRDTSFVLVALTESRESLKMLDGHCSDDISADCNSARYLEAVKYVSRLQTAKLVYRTLTAPIGHISVADHQPYSVRGYFIPAVGAGYQFITHIPLRQHWRIDTQGHSLVPIVPPIMLSSKYFTQNYKNKMDVLTANDLTVIPTVTAPCLTVLVQDTTLYAEELE